MPSIYKYFNYREYLRDYFVERKQFQQQLTHREILKKMGVTSSGFLFWMLPAARSSHHYR